MKAYSFENWTINSNTMPLLFFVQCMEEMLFPYGHDSYKVPALNFHFLCREILMSIGKMEMDVVDKGNMRPLFDELNSMLTNDDIAEKLYGTDFNCLFYNKNDKGEYHRDCSQLIKEPGSEASIRIIEKTLMFLVEDMENEDKYFNTLKLEIENILNDSNFDEKNAKKLYSLSKILLTELVNRGYSQEYIYAQIKERYYSDNVVQNDVQKELDYFWSMFSFEEREYKVILPVRRADIKKFLERFQVVIVSENVNKLFGNSCKWIVEISVNSLDSENARLEAISIISLFVSLKQYNSHMSSAFNPKSAIVIDILNEKQYSLSGPVKLLSRGRTRTEQQMYMRIGEMLHSFPIIGEKMVNVINLHASAMESTNVSNQLLNLWTIIELLIDIEKRLSYSKIVQIGNTLTTVLNASYIKSILEQLVFDLKHCSPNFEEFLANISKGESEIEKILSVLILSEYLQKKEELLQSIQNYPLLVYRIQNYSKLFSDRIEIKNLLIYHRKRLEWQIMRIYRNRNMIVHDGTHFPYIDLLVQNLHYYVDFLIDTINYYVGKGYESLETIYVLLGRNEYEYQMLLEKKDNNKNPQPVIDDYISVVLGNSYID